jgi:cellulose synthase/poly-beta-1,6-N-acetylglucosamine synthase-like glycosyltransferase
VTPPEVTVVIPARDEEASIASCLRSVRSQDLTDMEILVVDGGSDDATADLVRTIAAEDPRVRLLHNPTGRIPTALNIGLGAATGRWLVRVDAHSTVTPDHVRTLVGHLRTGRWGGVGARKDADARTSMGRAIALALGSPLGVGDSAYHWAEEPRIADHVPFGAYPVALLRDLGGWDERLDANEDFELDLRVRRAGHELLLDPSVRIAWRSKETLGALLRQYRRYGKGKADVSRMHPGTLAPRHLAAPALIALFAVAALAAPFAPRVAAALAAPYVAFLAIAGPWIAVRAGQPEAALRVASALAAMHLGWGLGFWEGRLRRARRITAAAAAPA